MSSATKVVDQRQLFEEILAAHADENHGFSGQQLRMHVTLHTVAETQIRTGDPPEAGNALDRLCAEGLSRHEAVHAIAALAARHSARVLGQGKKYDGASYAAELEALDGEGWRKLKADLDLR